MSSVPFDVTMKVLIEDDARAWAERFDPYPVLDVSVINADVSTVTAHADKVLRVRENDGAECSLNIEAEGSHTADIPDRLLHYSILLRHRHGVPVRSVVILLRRSANASVVTGTLEVRRRPEEPPYLTFTYEVVRLWAEPLAPLLDGPLGLLPLAALTDEAQTDLPAVVGRVIGRLRAATTRERSGKVKPATLILMGMGYEYAFVEHIFQGIQEMEESTTYQAILRRGEERGAMRTLRETILRQGRRKLGEPSAEQVQYLEGIANLEKLQDLTDRGSSATTWQELLA